MCGWVEFHAFPQLRILLDRRQEERCPTLYYTNPTFTFSLGRAPAISASLPVTSCTSPGFPPPPKRIKMPRLVKVGIFFPGLDFWGTIRRGGDFQGWILNSIQAWLVAYWEIGNHHDRYGFFFGEGEMGKIGTQKYLTLNFGCWYVTNKMR